MGRLGRLLGIRRHGLLERLVELHAQAVHAVGEAPDLHGDPAAPSRHYRHRPGQVGDGPDVRRERALAHLRELACDRLADVADELRLCRAVGVELRDQLAHVVHGFLKLENLGDAPLLVGAELGGHGSSQSCDAIASVRTRPSSGSLGVRPSRRAAAAVTTLSTSTPKAASFERSGSSSIPLSNPNQSAPPTRASSAALTPRMTLSGTTRCAPGCPSARERSGNGVIPWSAVSTTSTFPLPYRTNSCCRNQPRLRSSRIT